jgi:hypothetical protein
VPNLSHVITYNVNRYSVVPVVTRTLKEDDQLEGKTVPAGTMIVCHLQVSVVALMYLEKLVCLCIVATGSACVCCIRTGQC